MEVGIVSRTIGNFVMFLANEFSCGYLIARIKEGANNLNKILLGRIFQHLPKNLSEIASTVSHVLIKFSRDKRFAMLRVVSAFVSTLPLTGSINNGKRKRDDPTSTGYECYKPLLMFINLSGIDSETNNSIGHSRRSWQCYLLMCYYRCQKRASVLRVWWSYDVTASIPNLY